MNGISQIKLEEYCYNSLNVTVIVVSGGERKWITKCPNLYFRKTRVGYQNSDPFAKCFSRFLDQVRKNGERTFQILEPEAPILESLAIVCQAYAAAGIVKGIIRADSEFGKAIGWGSLHPDTISCLSVRLGDLWPRFSRMEWWWSSLGICRDDGMTLSDAKYRLFLARLIMDIGLESSFRKNYSMGNDRELSDANIVALDSFLESQESKLTLSILKLLHAPAVIVSVVEEAYLQVKAFLE